MRDTEAATTPATWHISGLPIAPMEELIAGQNEFLFAKTLLRPASWGTGVLISIADCFAEPHDQQEQTTSAERQFVFVGDPAAVSDQSLGLSGS